MSLSTGTRLGPYKILAPLGAGGMGEVYRAMDTRLGRTVAVKVLAEHLSQDSKGKHRFEREARAAARLRALAGPLPAGDDRPPSSAKVATVTPAELRVALVGRWEGMGIRVRLEFRSDGIVVAGGSGDGKEKRWEVVASDRIRVDGEEQRVEVDGEVLTLSTRGPTLRLRRVH